MDPPQPRPEMDTIEWLEFWLELLERDPQCGPTVLPLANADLRALKAELLAAETEHTPARRRTARARRALRLAGELAIEIMKRFENGDICGFELRPPLAAA